MSMSFWKGAFDGSVRGIAKLHSIEQSLMITFGRGYSNTGTRTQRRDRVRWKEAAENLGVQSLSLQSWHILFRGQVHTKHRQRAGIYVGLGV